MSSWSFSNFNKQLNQCCFQRPGVSINYSLRRNWPVWRCGEQQEPEAPHWYPPPPLATTVCSRCRCSDVCSILSRVGWIQHEWARVTGNGWEWAGVCGSWQWECRGRGRSGYGFMADAAVECDRRVGKAAGAPLCWRVWREPSSYSPVSKSSFFLSLPEDREFSCPQATFDLLVICFFSFMLLWCCDWSQSLKL